MQSRLFTRDHLPETPRSGSDILYEEVRRGGGSQPSTTGPVEGETGKSREEGGGFFKGHGLRGEGADASGEVDARHSHRADGAVGRMPICGSSNNEQTQLIVRIRIMCC